MLMSPGISPMALRQKIHYYNKQGDLYHLRRGLYAKSSKPHYNLYEVAIRLYTPSYISFETVLYHEGIICQHYSQIFVASYQSKTVVIDEQEYTYKKLKPIVLTAADGVIIKKNYSIASAERAFLDTLYIYTDYYFDNLSSLNWEIVFKLVHLYRNNSLAKRVERYHNNYLKTV